VAKEVPMLIKDTSLEFIIKNQGTIITDAGGALMGTSFQWSDEQVNRPPESYAEYADYTDYANHRLVAEYTQTK
jgi:hypothetical protein